MASYGLTPKPSELGVEDSTTWAGDISMTTSTPAAHCCSAACTPLRSWRELIHCRAFSLPRTLDDAHLRIRTNLSYFAANYNLVLVLVLFLFLYPSSLLVFLVMRIAWLKFYFHRDAPLLVFGKEVGNGVVVAVLSGVTIGLLLLTGAAVGGFVFVAVVVLGHAVMRKTDDLYVQEAAGVGEGGRTDNRPLSP